MTQQISLVGGIAGEPIVEEKKASVAGILPGHLLKESGLLIKLHDVVATNAQPIFALKNMHNAGDVNTVYLNGETVRFGAYSTGQKVLALVAAAAPAILTDDPLESAGDGTLRKVVVDAATDETQRNSIVAYAIQDIDNSAGGTVVKIKTRVA